MGCCKHLFWQGKWLIQKKKKIFHIIFILQSLNFSPLTLSNTGDFLFTWGLPVLRDLSKASVYKIASPNLGTWDSGLSLMKVIGLKNISKVIGSKRENHSIR